MLKPARRFALRVANRILPDRLFVATEHALYHAGLPAIARPRTFSEYIHHRKLYDHDPRLPVFADKVRAKAEIAALLGDEWVTPSLWVGDAPEAIPFDDLPAGYVLKANHGTNMNFVARPGVPVDRDAARKLAAHWLGNDFGKLHREWAYRHIPRKLLVEPLLADGAPLVDYKFYVFGGKIGFIDVKLGRDDYATQTCAMMDAGWRRLPFRYGQHPDHPTDPPPPPSLDRLVAAAERVGALFDFVRVDFYDIAGEPRFGETTFYPSAGLSRFTPDRFDAYFGSLIPRGPRGSRSRGDRVKETAS